MTCSYCPQQIFLEVAIPNERSCAEMNVLAVPKEIDCTQKLICHSSHVYLDQNEVHVGHS